ncbi:MAG: spermine synthase [Verrucomicrobiae bacterium]|nr:spermine synthase [Verrucomicrobiae bacterium]
MKPVNNLAETRTPDGSRFSLHEHDGEFFLKLNGLQLMSTTSTLSERLLADYACPEDPASGLLAPKRVLIGGLGLGYSMKRVLELVGPGADVVVAELLPEVVKWNREFLEHINGHLIDDPRVTIFQGDVYECIRQAADGEIPTWDAILLDTDNGPTSLVQPQNHQIYGRKGTAAIWHSLTPGGRAAFWAATREPAFESRLRRDGFRTEWHAAQAHERAKRAAHRVYVGERPIDATGDRAPARFAPPPAKKDSRPKRFRRSKPPL